MHAVDCCKKILKASRMFDIRCFKELLRHNCGISAIDAGRKAEMRKRPLTANGQVYALDVEKSFLLPICVDQVPTWNDVNVRVASDRHDCNILDMCQMPDGSIILIDTSNKKLKILDEEFNVKDFYQFEKRPMSVVSVSSSQVVVLDETWKLNYISLLPTIALCNEVFLEGDHKSTGCMIFCNGQFWIHSFDGLYIYSSSGSLQKKIKDPLLERPNAFPSSICTNRDKTRVFVTTDNSVHALDTDGEILLSFPIRDEFSSITCSVDDVIMISSFLFNYVDMYDTEGKILGELIPETQIEGGPMSLLYDGKKNSLIIGYEWANEVRVFI